MSKDADIQQDNESEVWSAISAFEQILEAMPTDRASLEALSHAYEQIGDHTKAKEYLVRLGNVLLDEGDTAAAQELTGKLSNYSDDDADVAALIAKIAESAPVKDQPQGDSVKDDSSPAVAAKPAVRTTFSMADELSFAWNLMEAGELSQEEYANVVQDLTEMSANESDATVSVLHVLEARAFKHINKVMAYSSKLCSAPIISLPNFDIQYQAGTKLPMDFMVRRGALAFESIGDNILLVVMNPFDKELRKDIETQIGTNCHYFISLPAEFDKALEKISELIMEKASSEEEDE